MMACLWSVIVFFCAGIQICRTNEGLEHPPVGQLGVTKSSLPTTVSGGTTDMTSILKAHYRLNVTSRSTAAVGSTVKFDAVLLVNLTYTESLAATPERFIYHWMNTATKQLTQTVDGLSSNVMVTFDSQKVAAGDYLMTVAAYLKDDQTTIVAFETKMFTLTSQLNGLLVLAQKLDYQRYANIFATKAPVTLTADVHDQFLQSDLGYCYFWFQNLHKLGDTKQASYTTTFTQPFNSSLSTIIVVYTESSAGRAKDMFSAHIESTSLPSVNDASLAGSSDGPIKCFNAPSSTREAILALGPKYKGSESSFLFIGSFLESVEFKDVISDCVVTRIDGDQQDRAVSLKKTASVNITCAGSTPSSVCVSITDVNSSLPASNTCTPTLFVDKLDHIVPIHLASTGWKNVHFFVYNDVSRYQLVESFYGYDPDSLNVSALTIPIVFGVVGVIIILIGGVYFVRLRKKPLVEVADFDFHPLLTHSQTQDTFSFSRMANSIRAMLPQGTTEADNSKHRHRSATHGHKSATRDTERYDSPSQGLYESL